MDLAALTRTLKPDFNSFTYDELSDLVHNIHSIWKSHDVPPEHFKSVYLILQDNASVGHSILSCPPSLDFVIPCNNNFSAESCTLDNLLKEEIEDLNDEQVEAKIVGLLCKLSI